ncbi:GGDEF domain-containing protein [Rhodanobacter glycinis]|uniref:GGDEF domain-containing protein n=1 Tax=Rhodanobacter glycinis TaxID=582702 RepID=UPI001128D8B9|nr:GGDEF domain-containing protein [Rhodanobacter glycinis]TPG51365.1 GGDEF domain-containing protein [Rhodanobacter glycinis]
MHFDLFTLGVIGAAIGIAISMSFTLLGLVLRGLPALRIWVIAFWVLTAAALAQGLNEDGSMLSTIVGGGMIALANALMLMGIAIHLRYPLRWRWPMAVVGLFLANQISVYLSPPSQTVSALMFGAYSLVWDLWMIWVLLWRSPRDMRNTCGFTALIFAIDAVFYLLRSVVVLFPERFASTALDDLLTTWNYLFGILSSFLLSTGFTLMLAERLTLDLRRLAHTDGLTGLLNRGALIEAGLRLVDACRARGQACCVLMFDLDNFKAINDGWGHAAGDAVLNHFVEVIRDTGLAQGALFARYGGEEFVLVLPAIDPAQAGAMAERMRAAVAARSALFHGRPINITTSVGGAAAVDANFEQLVSAADVALYRAKRQGRNQVAWNPGGAVASVVP